MAPPFFFASCPFISMSETTQGVRVQSGSRALRAGVELLSSMRFAISLLTVICIASVIGTVLKQHEPAVNYVNQFGPFWAELFGALQLNAVYSAWWFLLILAFLVVSTSLCIARNTPKFLSDIKSYKENVREQSLRAFHHKAEGRLANREAWAHECEHRKLHMLRKTHYDQVPLKPQRVYEEMNQEFGRDTCYVTTIGNSQIMAAQMLKVYEPRNWINCGQAGPLGWTLPAALGVRAADPDREIVALSGDYDFQFMIEELAVGAQFKLPYIHMVVNNSYLGLIRQAQRGFNMDYCVQLGFDNINAPQLNGYGVDHQKVVEGLGCKFVRVHKQEEIKPAIQQANAWMAEFNVPVVIEVMLERVTNISMGTEIDAINEFEELAASIADAPTAIGLLD
mgnify:CR=1 FL=1